MAKDSPYFKFYVSEYNDGDIQLCSMEAQGLFTNLCSLYWSKEGELFLSKAKRLWKVRDKIWKELVDERVIKVKEDKISISFLDEQLEERLKNASKNAENGKKGGRPKTQNNPVGSQSVIDEKPNESNIEEKREEERIEERDIEVFGKKSKNQIKVKKVYAYDKIKHINDLREYFKSTGQLEPLIEASVTKFDEFMRDNPGKIFNDDGHVYNAFVSYCREKSTTEKPRYASPV